MDIRIPFAGYGLNDAAPEIRGHDRRMDTDGTEEFVRRVQETLRSKICDTFDTNIVDFGDVYERTLSGIKASLDSDVAPIEDGETDKKGHVRTRVDRGNIQTATDTPEMLCK